MGHAAPLQAVAAGVRALPGVADSFAATQAAWRFFRNEDTTPTVLAAPLFAEADRAVAAHCAEVALAACDWSQLHYRNHTRKTDRAALSNRFDPGCELFTALLISDRDGEPVAPVYASLRTADGILSTDADTASPKKGSKLDRLEAAFSAVAARAWRVPTVHIIDREADSVDHYRHRDRAGRLFLVRADDDDSRRVWYGDEELLLPEVYARLKESGGFRPSRAVQYRGAAATQYVAEARVTLSRPGKSKQRTVSKPGRSLTLRLIVAEVRDETGAVLARWLLLTNAPAAFDASRVALWYYWRWRIESFFKLLEGAGVHLEEWQQESGGAIFRRLLVASMACVLAWKVGRSLHPSADEFRRLLIRLSGRQMKWGVEYTEPALLAGLWALMQSLSVLETFDPAELRRLIREVLLDGGGGGGHPPPDPGRKDV